MGVFAFQPAAVLDGAQGEALSGVTAIATRATAAGPVAYVVDGPDQSKVLAYRIDTDGRPVLIDEITLPDGITAGVARGLSIMSLDGQAVAAITGVGDAGIYLVDLAEDGAFDSPRALSGDAPPATLQDCLTLAGEGGGDPVFYGYCEDAAQPLAWQLSGDTLTAIAPPPGAQVDPGAQAELLALAESPGGVLLGTSGSDHTLVSYLPDAQGQPREVARLGAPDGVGINTPATLEVLRAHDTDFAIVGGAGTGSLSVFQVDAAGYLTLRDHIVDGRDTRFDGVTVIESITVGARTYVVAAGADSGLTMFELLPDGRLLTLASLADRTSLTLQSPSAIGLSESGGVLSMLITSTTEPGLTALRVDPQGSGTVARAEATGGLTEGSDGGDLLVGGVGGDDLRGGAGVDVILDGDGEDTLRGGAGADIFVLSEDGLTDVIADFEPGIDRIDLSTWTFLRNTGQLEITRVAGGVEIAFGDEVLRVLTGDGTSPSADAVRGWDLLGPARYMPFDALATAPEGPVPLEVVGTDGDDLIEGSILGDTLLGGTGADTIRGYAGFDVVAGGAGHDNLFGNAGNDTVHGDGGNDTLNGGIGWDELHGGDGDDLIRGLDGFDTLTGGAGDDHLFGNAGNDHLFGNGSNDTLNGGIGWDVLHGGDGLDRLEAMDGYDTLYGDAGDDTLFGNAGNDEMHGGSGNDVLDGGIGWDAIHGDAGNDLLRGMDGFDTLYGGPGNDTLYGNNGNDLLGGGDGDDQLHGGVGADTLDGDAGQDTLYGDRGPDVIRGGAGNDRLEGNAGNDTLLGGAGDDTLRGGLGADEFVFTEGHDRIVDMQFLVDTIAIDAEVMAQIGVAQGDIMDLATRTDDGVLFEFSAADSLLVFEFFEPGRLEDVITFV
jgi:Ca2+-binding RTX toxin-like protein